MNYYEADDNEIREFVEEKMSEYNSSLYTKDEFNSFFTEKHINIAIKDENNEFLAFACLLVLDKGYKMCYTYTSIKGKKAYTKGIDYILAKYTPMYFGEGALKFNKIRRLLDE